MQKNVASFAHEKVCNYIELDKRFTAEDCLIQFKMKQFAGVNLSELTHLVQKQEASFCYPLQDVSNFEESKSNY